MLAELNIRVQDLDPATLEAKIQELQEMLSQYMCHHDKTHANTHTMQHIPSAPPVGTKAGSGLFGQGRTGEHKGSTIRPHPFIQQWVSHYKTDHVTPDIVHTPQCVGYRPIDPSLEGEKRRYRRSAQAEMNFSLTTPPSPLQSRQTWKPLRILLSRSLPKLHQHGQPLR
jgi:hypothetical protein